jgi:Domain of Unknown Function (DUF928)
MLLNLLQFTPLHFPPLGIGRTPIPIGLGCILGCILSVAGGASPATAEPGRWSMTVRVASPQENRRSSALPNPPLTPRGCEASGPLHLTLLTPPEHAATTLSAHPTLLWQVSGPSDAPMQFTFMASGSTQPIYQQTLKADRAGVVAVTLPENTTALELGQQYRWTVSLMCDADRPSQNVYARAWVTRVAPSTTLALQLMGIKPGPEAEQQRALAYATAGVWYDAVASLNQAQTSIQTPNSPQAPNLSPTLQVANSLQSLLDQIGLPSLTAKE